MSRRGPDQQNARLLKPRVDLSRRLLERQRRMDRARVRGDPDKRQQHEPREANGGRVRQLLAPPGFGRRMKRRTGVNRVNEQIGINQNHPGAFILWTISSSSSCPAMARALSQLNSPRKPRLYERWR